MVEADVCCCACACLASLLVCLSGGSCISALSPSASPLPPARPRRDRQQRRWAPTAADNGIGPPTAQIAILDLNNPWDKWTIAGMRPSLTIEMNEIDEACGVQPSTQSPRIPIAELSATSGAAMPQRVTACLRGWR